jgi:DNA-binding MarR family transcriptional regulator
MPTGFEDVVTRSSDNQELLNRMEVGAIGPKGTVPMAEEDVELVSALRNVVTKLSRAQRMEAMRAAGMPHSHITLLSTLEREGTMTPTELSLAEGVKMPVMTRALAAVVKRGFVRRERHPVDGRQVLLELSESGREALQLSRGAINDWYLMHLSRLDASGRSALLESVLALSQIADQLVDRRLHQLPEHEELGLIVTP